jgi:hypothetical protein
MNATMAQLTGQDYHQVINTGTFMDAGRLAKEFKTDEIYNALGIVGARLMIENRPYNARLKLIDSISTGEFNSTVREISYFSTWALPSGAFNTDLYTNFADGFNNGTNPSDGTPQSTGDQYEQHPVHPFEQYFMDSQVWQDCLTRYVNQIKIVFNSEAEWGRFWAGVVTEKSNDIEQRKAAYNRLTLLSRMGLAAAMGDYSSAIKGACTVYDLTAAFNKEMGTNYTGTQLRTTYRKQFLEWFTAEIKIISDLMAKRSVFFHATPVLTLSDGDHVILRHTPKSEQRLMMYSPFWEKAKTMVMPEIFNDKYLKTENFEAVDYWQTFSMDDSIKASANIKIKIPAWLENLIGNTTGSSDTDYVFQPDYLMGCIFDRRAVMTNFQMEDARTSPLESRKNYLNTWFDFVKSNICNPTHNFVLLVMSENEQATEDFTGDGATTAFTLTGNVERVLGVTVGGTATTAYTVNGKVVTFTSAPANNAAVKITYLVDQHPSA